MPRSQPAISSSVLLVPPVSARPPASGVARGLLPLLLRPEPRVRQVPQHALLDPHHAAQRQALVVERLAEQRRIGRIGVERHALVHHLLADAGAAARLRERASPFVGVARVERRRQQRHEVVHRLRLEHRRVEAGLDRLRVAAGHRLLRRDAADRRRIDARPSRARPRWPSRCRCRPAFARSPRSSASVRAVIREEARRSSPRPSTRALASRNPALKICPAGLPGGVGGLDGAAHRGRARLRIEVGGAVDERGDGRVGLRAELRHQLGILGRQPRQSRRQVHRAPAATRRRARWSSPRRGAGRSWP